MFEILIHIIDSEEISELLSWIMSTIGLKVKAHTNIQNLLMEYNPLQPGCILLDAYLPNLDISALQRSLKVETVPILPIIFMSWENDIQLAVKMMQKGASDFLLKPFNEEILIDSINNALNINQRNIRKLNEIYQARNKYLDLSYREKQVFQGVVAGKSNKMISHEIAISLKTIEAHRASMMKKMGVKSIARLVKFSYQIEK